MFLNQAYLLLINQKWSEQKDLRNCFFFSYFMLFFYCNSAINLKFVILKNKGYTSNLH